MIFLINPEKRSREAALSGDIPSPFDIPKGCRFHPRCEYAIDKCSSVDPKANNISENHYSLCHLYNKL